MSNALPSLSSDCQAFSEQATAGLFSGDTHSGHTSKIKPAACGEACSSQNINGDSPAVSAPNPSQITRFTPPLPYSKLKMENKKIKF